MHCVNINSKNVPIVKHNYSAIFSIQGNGLSKIYIDQKDMLPWAEPAMPTLGFTEETTTREPSSG